MAGGWSRCALNLRNGGLQVAAFLGAESTHVDASLSRVPAFAARPGRQRAGPGRHGGRSLVYDVPRGGMPTGTLNLRVRGLSRSGLALSSAPIDMGVNAVLDSRRGAMRAVISEGGTVIGRAQALVTPLGPGSLVEAAQRRASASADQLCRRCRHALAPHQYRAAFHRWARDHRGAGARHACRSADQRHRARGRTPACKVPPPAWRSAMFRPAARSTARSCA